MRCSLHPGGRWPVWAAAQFEGRQRGEVERMGGDDTASVVSYGVETWAMDSSGSQE
jgi:hypothetical protein